MISTSGVSLRFGGKKLFEDATVKFSPGNCYGLIGANGAGKSTFLKILSKEIEPNSGEVIMPPDARLSILKQNHFEFDEVTVLNTVLMGNKKLFSVMQEKEKIYSNPDFSEADGERAGVLEMQFAEMNGYEAESEAGSLLAGLAIGPEIHPKLVKELTNSEKVKVLLAQALFGQPDILLLDEPTNNLDIYAIKWLQDFLMNFKNTVIVVSHDRHFLNTICTHIADIDYGKVTAFSGNYDFWLQASELQQRLLSDQNKKSADRAEELKAFIARFSANASKSAQASSRQKALEKLTFNEMPASSRKRPFVGFESLREAGQDILTVSNLSYQLEGEQILKNLSFTLKRGDKAILLGKSDLAKTILLDILNDKIKPDSGTVSWGITITKAYLPADNSEFFQNGDLDLVNWLRQFSTEKDESFIRGFLGKMLFSGSEALKKSNVLSGGEKVRCMLSKIMLSGANVLMLDGPTAHLDLESISAVNDGLKSFKGTALFTCHDHEFIQTTANRIIDIENGSIKDDRYCTYEEYLGL